MSKIKSNVFFSYIFQCKGGNSLYGLAIQCCNSDMCNKDIRPMYIPHTTTTLPPKIQINSIPWIAFALSMVICLLVSMIIIGWVYFRYRKREKNRLYALASTDSYISGNSNLLQTLIGHSSGSGSGIPLLVRNTIIIKIYGLQFNFNFVFLLFRFKEQLLNKLESNNK